MTWNILGMKHIGIVLLLSMWTAQLQSQHQEPMGGLYPSTLTIFGDEVANGISAGPFGAKLSVDTGTKKTGTASWRWEVKGSDGVHILWGGWGKDTTVFWVHDNSHVSFWVRPGNDKVKINVLLGYMDGRYEVLRSSVVGQAGIWRYMDLLVPSEAVGRPLNDLKIITHANRGGSTTLHFDDMKISRVRLYAGKGTPQSISGVFVDQVGYDTYGIKTFSSEKYETYEIIQVGDGKTVYKGNDSRMVSSDVINDRAAYVGDFTKLQTPGHYYIRLDNGQESYPFDIGPHVYDRRLRAAIRFFYYQRNNTSIEMPFAEGPWVHSKDEKEVVLLPRGQGTKVVRRGWHDAGDLAIYMPNHTYACFWLALAWDEFRFGADTLNIPESGDGIPDLINELRWGLDWILDMQDMVDGGFYQNMCVRKDSPYRYGKTTPLTITGYELTNKTTAATAAAVGVLAYASMLFEGSGFDGAYAMRMKRAALDGWNYLQSNPRQISVTENCKTYQDADDIHARFFASAALFLATEDEQYHNYVLANDPGSKWISDYNNQTNLAYLFYLKSPKGDPKKQRELREMLTRRARKATADSYDHPFGFIGYYYWGSLGTALARAGNYSVLDWNLTGEQSSIFTALQQLHYIFGQNSLGFVYFSGFGTNGMKNSFHHWLKTLNAVPRNFPGMLPGGPNKEPDPKDRDYPPRTYGYSKPADTPIDSRYADTDSWSTNEIAVNQSAQLVYVLCAAQSYAYERERDRSKARKK